MKIIVIGLGVQGKKRLEIAGKDCVATVDPFKEGALFKHVSEVPIANYDAALVCTPEDQKLPLLDYLLGHGKHVLVEKPLLAADNTHLKKIKNLAEEQGVACYTAYNHRFEPHFVKVRERLKDLGKIYSCRLFYGNGTARDVRNSPWRDKELGVLTDLGSHLLNTLLFWFNDQIFDFKIVKSNRFENKSFDHVVMISDNDIFFNLEMSLISWRNHFSCDIIGEHGSCHVDSLCKWGPSSFIFRTRKLPSGRPDEEVVTLVQSDTTWKDEYQYFLKFCDPGFKQAKTNLDNDIIINTIFKQLNDKVLC